MTVLEFYNKLNTIKDLQHFKHFSFYFHGSIINNPDNAGDIDVKLVRRIKPVSLLMIEQTMEALGQLDIDVVYFNDVSTWAGKYKPTLKQIDETKPVLQAVIDADLAQLEKRKRNNKIYQYRGGVKYKKIGRLIFYKSSEWAVCGDKYNENWTLLTDVEKNDLEHMEELHKSGWLHRETSNHEMVADIEIREFLQTPNVEFLSEIEERFKRIL